MSNNNNGEIYDKVMSQMLSLSVDYKNMRDLGKFKLYIKNIISNLFTGPYEVSSASDFIYIGQSLTRERQYQPNVMIPHGIGMQIKFDKSYKIGNWIHGKLCGYCHSKYPDGSVYRGGISKTSHKPDGYGVGGSPGKVMYEGDWKDGVKHGEGLRILFVEGTKKITSISKGYFNMGAAIGIHLQSSLSEEKTYIINNDYNTKETLPSFIPPGLFKKASLLKYQPVPPRLSGVVDVKAAELRARVASEASMTPAELKLARSKAKKLAQDALRTKTKASRSKPTAVAKVETVVVPVVYEVNPDDLSDDDEPKKKKNDDTCVICYTNEIDCVILECGHLAICYLCSKDPSFKGDCPICRRVITRVAQVYRAR
jgi:hypothetical protein